MALNGCSKKMCPFQVETANNCNLAKEQCPYFTQDIDYHQVLKQIKVEIAKEIFEELDKLTYRLLNDADYTIGDIVYDITKLKNKYIGEKEDESKSI